MASVFDKLEGLNKKIERGFGGEMTQTSGTSPNHLNIKWAFLPQPKHSSRKEKIPYICGLRARIECEPFSEHSTRSDRVTDIGYLLFSGASTFPAANPQLTTSPFVVYKMFSHIDYSSYK